VRNMTYCCSLFQDALSLKGEGGLAVVARRNDVVGLYFDIEFRAFAKNNEPENLDTGEYKCYLWGQNTIKYCPWCGINLDDFYNDKQFGLELEDDEEWGSGPR
jgi:hypothetical protein